MGSGSSTYPSPNALVTATIDSGGQTTIATANLQRAGLYVFNPSATVTLWVSPTGTHPTANGPGSIAVQPLQGVMFGPPNTPPWTSGMNVIASASSGNPICVLEFYQ